MFDRPTWTLTDNRFRVAELRLKERLERTGGDLSKARERMFTAISLRLALAMRRKERG